MKPNSGVKRHAEKFFIGFKTDKPGFCRRKVVPTFQILQTLTIIVTPPRLIHLKCRNGAHHINHAEPLQAVALENLQRAFQLMRCP